MSTFLVGVAVIIGLVWGVPWIAAQLFGERSSRRGVIGLFVLLCVLFLAAAWLIYFADSETQWAVTEGGLGLWGFVTGVVKLLLAAGMLWSAGYVWREARKIPSEWGGLARLGALVLTIFFVLVALLLTLQALVDMFL